MKALTKQEKLELAQLYEQGTESLSEFSLRHGIKKENLYYWRKKLEIQKTSPSSFVPINVSSPITSTQMSIRFPNGIELDLSGMVPIEYLKMLIQG